MAATATYLYAFRTQDGALIRVAKLRVTALAIGNNTVAHGLTDGFGNGVTPLTVGIEPTQTGNFYEYAVADATNLYINAPAAAAACDVYVEY